MMNKLRKVTADIQAFGPVLVLGRKLKKRLPIEQWYVREVEAFLQRRVLSKVTYEPYRAHVGADSPIWIMWWQGEDAMPAIVKIAYASVHRFAGKRPVKLITKDNYAQYVSRAQSLYAAVGCGAVSLAHFSDYLRFELLFRYGGIWLDATVLMTAAFPRGIDTLRLFSIKQGNHPLKLDGKWNPNWSRDWAIYCMGGGAGDSFFRLMLDCWDEYRVQGLPMLDYLLTDRMIGAAYNAIDDVHDAIDAIPVNNWDALYMESMLDKPMKDFQSDKGTFLHKLSWKTVHNQEGSERSLYECLCAEYLG